jgi:hypothetical protein
MTTRRHEFNQPSRPAQPAHDPHHMRKTNPAALCEVRQHRDAQADLACDFSPRQISLGALRIEGRVDLSGVKR